MAKNASGISIDKGMRKGLLKIMVLGYIARNNTYPYALLKTIKAASHMHVHVCEEVTKNDIYNLTASLEKDGFIKGKTQLRGGKAQRIFTITSKGRNIVKNKNRIVAGMISELTQLAENEGFNA